MRAFLPFVVSSFLVFFVVTSVWSTGPEVTTNESNGRIVERFDFSSIFSNGSIPNGPISYREESEEQRKNWERVLDRCTPIDTEVSLSPICHSALTKYFMEEPVWEYSFEMGFQDLTSIYGLQEGIINPRHRGLNKYGYEDYASDEIPVWRDVFDGGIEKRINVFLRTVVDPSCKEIFQSNETGFREDLAERCAAGELYKYATYLESCTTALTRLFVLKSPPIGDEYLFESPSIYEAFIEVILKWEWLVDEKWRVEGGLDRMRKGYLHASWVAKQCETLSFALLPDGSSPTLYSWSSLGNLPENDDMRALISKTFLAALEISVKTGDERAVRTYPLRYFEHSEDAMILWDVRKRFPILTHKSLGFELGGELTYEEQRRHRAKAYLLTEKLAGTDVARRDFDVSDLQKELDYVQDGGALKYPAMWSRKPKAEESMPKLQGEEALKNRID